ncbi:hypothetical protein BJ741DRAFT_609013 [Chytriomyces cf. hyalinus JEL632]|nr:hypothetical protein BJ741DRAFT_609013 [Chytriomyces cf. hyalinus JEL632]
MAGGYQQSSRSSTSLGDPFNDNKAIGSNDIEDDDLPVFFQQEQEDSSAESSESEYDSAMFDQFMRGHTESETARNRSGAQTKTNSRFGSDAGSQLASTPLTRTNFETKDSRRQRASLLVGNTFVPLALQKVQNLTAVNEMPVKVGLHHGYGIAAGADSDFLLTRASSSQKLLATPLSTSQDSLLLARPASKTKLNAFGKIISSAASIMRTTTATNQTLAPPPSNNPHPGDASRQRAIAPLAVSSTAAGKTGSMLMIPSFDAGNRSIANSETILYGMTGDSAADASNTNLASANSTAGISKPAYASKTHLELYSRGGDGYESTTSLSLVLPARGNASTGAIISKPPSGAYDAGSRFGDAMSQDQAKRTDSPVPKTSGGAATAPLKDSKKSAKLRGYQQKEIYLQLAWIFGCCLLVIVIYDFACVALNDFTPVTAQWLISLQLLQVAALYLSLLSFIYANEAENNLRVRLSATAGAINLFAFILRAVFQLLFGGYIPYGIEI